ncbi:MULTISPECIES: cyclic nucleotide-binding domain-containing protein [Trichocoleus]|uniref:Cyclic nucleotide-binding domain-containing protein n=1 Tax=Trichocoleus desertorum GB2-A4 TaxID=2933944 RepID=A0ABV0J4K6_9CYAN|nr:MULTISPECIES: cyclic nucleotide-binding domain-containing protein [unclassified Trichocoleus]MBD1862060.1 cyclic nucleotide-binding domain-containing protein [Trichocoleus sp. FACHB-46]MBD2098677.1 cyclic nucleotide-binding domain-containing protein [Trichocoleus sp. FACHB-591]MBD2122870.1 cyclic nucleotide-binding domain-containing protein [Trichocoleus sp. FACHB-262]
MLDPVTTLSIFQRQPEPQHFSTDQVIFETGQPAELMYGILSGTVGLVINNRVVETLERGEVFGVGALIGAKTRNYTAVAETDCQLAFLDQKRFLFAVQETPIFALEVMKSYSERLSRLLQLL